MAGGSKNPKDRFAARGEHLSRALLAAQLHLWEWDIKSDLVHRSEHHDKHLFGLEEEIPVFRPADFSRFIHPDDNPIVFQAIQDALAGVKDYSVQYRIIWPDGSIRWRWTQGVVERDGTVPVRMTGWTMDITEQKRIAHEREQSDTNYKNIFDASPHPKFILHPETLQFLEANLAATQVYGYEREEFLQMSAVDIRASEDRAYFLKNFDRLKRGQFLKDEEIRHQRKDGTVIDVKIAAAPIVFRGAPAILALVTDITDMLRTQAELQAAKQAAEAANKAKSQFLANMSHEIRTPMNAILGFAEIMDDHDRTEEDRKRFLARVRANGDHLLRLIDDVLDLSKVEAGKIQVEKRPVSLQKLLEDSLSAFDGLIATKGLERIISIQSDVPKSLFTDGTRLRQIVSNLLSNAVKFTDKGKIRIEVKVNPTTEIGPAVEVDVEDTGTGIPHESQSTLFEPFVQADASVTRRFGGTGLGLALSRKLANALGGDVRLVHSTPNSGSRFRLLIPATQGASFIVNERELRTNSKTLEDMDLNGIRILLAEDSPDNEALIKAYLHKSGVSLEVARNGHEAIETALKQPFELILMDIQMPGLDGLEATRRLRAQGWIRPIIALTAHALPEEINRSLEAGCNAHISKPVRRHDLVKTISEFVTETRHRGESNA